MEDVRDVEQTNNIVLFVANRLGSLTLVCGSDEWNASMLTRCLKCFCTISCSASVALVVSRVTIGLRVMIRLTEVVCGSTPSEVTYRKMASSCQYL